MTPSPHTPAPRLELRADGSRVLVLSPDSAIASPGFHLSLSSPDGRQGVTGIGHDEESKALETDLTSYWPALKPHLQGDANSDDDSSKKVRAECIICLRPLMTWTEPGGADDDDSYQPWTEYALVLPCGHLVGDQCMRTWRKHQERDTGRPPRCPLCKYSLQFKGCGHAITGVLAPVYPCDDVGQVPLTVPEGGRVPDQCHDCEKRDYIDVEVTCRLARKSFRLLRSSANMLSKLREQVGVEFDDAVDKRGQLGQPQGR